jgi:hypothetical protein
MSEPDVPSTPDGPPPEPIPVAQVWRPSAAAPPPLPPPPQPSHPNYAGAGQYDIYGNSYGPWTPARPYKPGTVTALGIMSVIVASLTFVGVVMAAAQSSVQLAMVQASRAMAMAAQRAQAQQQQQSAVPAGLPAKENGLGPAERDVAISVFAARQSLSNERMAQLDAVLAEGGQTILNVRPGLMTSSVVRAAIQSTTVGRSARSNQAGPAIFNLSKGTLELYDDHAVFRPEDHSLDPIRAQADVNAYLAAHADPTASPAPTTSTATITLPPPPPANLMRAASTAMGMTMLEAGLSFLLAIYLLVTGILTLRGVRAGGLMHWIYVVAKTFLVVLAFLAWAQFDRALTNLRNATAPPGYTGASGGSVFAMGMSTLAAGYVMLVIVLLLIPATREFYRKQA